MIKLKIKYGNSQTDLRFPCTEKEMNAALERIHAEDVTPLELYVSEVIFPEELGFLQDRFANLDEVNYIAKRMDSFFGDEEYQFYDSEYLLHENEKQALEKYVNGDYKLGKLDEYGQRISIKCEIPRKDTGETISYMTGWMVYPNGEIRLNTPYGGK
mgnify:CR=1 FL=1